jgi:hypothetical protein
MYDSYFLFARPTRCFLVSYLCQQCVLPDIIHPLTKKNENLNSAFCCKILKSQKRPLDLVQAVPQSNSFRTYYHGFTALDPHTK